MIPVRRGRVPKTNINPQGIISLGRLRPKERPKLHLKDYATVSFFADVPTSVDYSAKAQNSLSNIYGNDVLGCCVISMCDHLVGVETGNADNEKVATLDQVIADYSAIGGYNPNDPTTDNGCDEQTAFSYYQQNGFFDGTKLAGYVAVDATNKELVKAAIYWFENVCVGFEIPDSGVSPIPASGQVWNLTGAPNPSNGHAVMVVGYDDSYVYVATWGMILKVTWDAFAMYMVPAAGGECYALLTPDELASGQEECPNGIAWASLQADFAALGQAPSPPAPPPPPDPQPTPPDPTPPDPGPDPSGSPTLEDAIAWATQGLIDNWPAVTEQMNNAIRIGAGAPLGGRNRGVSLENAIAWATDWPAGHRTARIAEVLRRDTVESLKRNWKGNPSLEQAIAWALDWPANHKGTPVADLLSRDVVDGLTRHWPE